jgi:hypothetical protein
MKKNNNTITRKEALKKMGRYASLTAVGTFTILTPSKAAAASPAASPSSPYSNPFNP